MSSLPTLQQLVDYLVDEHGWSLLAKWHSKEDSMPATMQETATTERVTGIPQLRVAFRYHLSAGEPVMNFAEVSDLATLQPGITQENGIFTCVFHAETTAELRGQVIAAELPPEVKALVFQAITHMPTPDSVLREQVESMLTSLYAYWRDIASPAFDRAKEVQGNPRLLIAKIAVLRVRFANVLKLLGQAEPECLEPTDLVFSEAYATMLSQSQTALEELLDYLTDYLNAILGMPLWQEELGVYAAAVFLECDMVLHACDRHILAKTAPASRLRTHVQALKTELGDGGCALFGTYSELDRAITRRYRSAQ